MINHCRKILAALALPLLLITQLQAAQQRPNIVIILADDLGYNDVGFTGDTPIQTPNLDQLAADGVRFDNAYVTHPYCGPSRAALLTGRYQARFGMENNVTYAPYDRHMGLPLDQTMFPKRLQQAGYKTGMVGKWHLGGALHFQPQNRGFDYFYGFLGGGHNYHPDDVAVGHTDEYWMPMVRNGKPAEFDEYMTTALSKDAAQFIERNAEQPFMLYVSYNAPHTPLEAPAELIAKYQHLDNPNRAIYAAMIDSMDQGIGLLVDTLKQTNTFDNTLIFFLSDNGGVYPEYWQPNFDWSDNSPFRRGKVSLFEGGIHVPFIAHWPAKIGKGQAFTGLVSSLDIAATSLALAGADTSGLELDGKNLIPYLDGRKTGSPHHALFWRLEEADHIWAVRTENAKYMRQLFKGVDGPGFFDMAVDPAEQNNLYGQRPEQQAQLAELWNQWNSKNQQNVLEQAGPYKKSITEFYDQHYQQRVKQAQERQNYVVK
ncbi:sulfatase-like hydrolase/transferase [Neiella sp. HB171785]|uniref:Sulfatase-like hydrolase/transferase n=1 Tax=Neiella litorisoli TaxID=2771431 RepID=A0A8J6UGF3_9GAMM|nr:sulfatase-like hydrolase/transferase [Neiella litorisoli]MBD1390016.1 sulfatase-like hydrolase/transferase [Neiella litorisoli]